ncbi:MAG: phosphotransferase enzyme family protein [Candidatus Odinarchaeota archaeon]
MLMNIHSLENASKEYINQICERYGIKPENLSFIGGLENFVYAFQKNNRDYILRIGYDSHMSFDLVQAEIDWILYLTKGNVPVVRPIPSSKGAFVEKIDIEGTDTYLNAVAFEKAKGQHLDHHDPRKWNEEFIKQWGKIVGRMHVLAKDYTPKSAKRYEFNPQVDVQELLAHEEKETIDRISTIFQNLEKLPKTKDSFGLIHSDLHAGNFLVEENSITAILDFDRACYKWFISDVAIALYYPLYMSQLQNSQKAQKEFIGYFLPLFWEGYESENRLEPFWKDTLNTFITVRDAILYMYLPRADQFRRDLESIKRRIIGKDPYIDVQGK